MYEKAKVSVEKIPGLIERYKGDLKFTIDVNPFFTYQKRAKNMKEKEEDVLELVKKILFDIKTLLD
jgi:transcription-repair coupling factor (superfamily II helicase)